MSGSPIVLGLLSGTGLGLAYVLASSWWLVFVALVPLLLACRGTLRRAVTAAGFTSLSLVPLVYSGVLTAPQGKTVFAGILIGNVLHFIFFCTAVWAMRRCGPLSWAFGTATVWLMSEYARTMTVSASPLALVLAEHPEWIQGAAWTGILGISFALVWFNGVVASWLSGTARQRAWIWGAGLPVLWLPLVPAWPDEAPSGQALRVLAVQGGVPEEIQRRMRTGDLSPRLACETYLSLTRHGARFQPDMVAWPEIAVFGWNEAVPDWQDQLADLGLAQSHFLVGTQRETALGTYNSALFLDPSGGILDVYDKRRLVPITESTLKPGDGDGLIDLDQHRLGVGLCFEVVFPQLSRQQVLEGAEALMVLSNSASLSGALPHIQSAHAVFRAVEVGRWMVTVNAVEESRVIDATGRTVALSPTYQAAIIPAVVPTRRDLTPYAQYGDWFSWCCMGGWIVGMARRRTLRGWQRAALPASPALRH